MNREGKTGTAGEVTGTAGDMARTGGGMTGTAGGKTGTLRGMTGTAEGMIGTARGMRGTRGDMAGIAEWLTQAANPGRSRLIESRGNPVMSLYLWGWGFGCMLIMEAAIKH